MSCDFKVMKKNILWAVCPFCSAHVILKTSVSIGFDIKDSYQEAEVK